MYRRPLHHQFSDAVREGRKITTIRNNPWPVGKPIMLYNWSGPPYRSKQIDVTTVIVEATAPIEISGAEPPRGMLYLIHGNLVSGSELWRTEGFGSPEAMDDWFRRLAPPGRTILKTIMRFHLAPTPTPPA